jgi:phage terminase large subunit GpA-like protein
VLEEYNDRGRCGSIFVPEGRDRQGWNRFIEDLQLVIQTPVHSWEIPKEKKKVLGGVVWNVKGETAESGGGSGESSREGFDSDG